MIEVLSLGAGVQSTTVLLMSLRGELPKLDAAVFSDTGWESSVTYEHVRRLTDIAGSNGLKVYRVSNGNIRADAMRSQVRGVAVDGHRWASMPYFTLGPNGEKGMIKRQCTSEYKIAPIHQFIRRTLLGLAKGQRAMPDSVRIWQGISADEQRRVRISRDRWCQLYYPLVHTTPMTRATCIQWLVDHGYEVPIRSSCIGCPFKSNNEWLTMKRDRPKEWEDAVMFDADIRKCGGMRGDVFLHRSCVPLPKVNLDDDQGNLWVEECLGYCGN